MSDGDDDAGEFLGSLVRHLENANGSLDAAWAEAAAAEWAARPQVKRSLQAVWPALVLLYGLLVLAGVVLNGLLLAAAARRPANLDRNTRALVANVAAANLAQAAIVLPTTLAVMLLNKWIFGRALCYCLPMIQDTPLHVTMFTFLLLAADRYRVVLYPYKPRIPVCVCAIGTWLFAICIVVPYPFYLTYLDLGLLVPLLEGIGMCAVNLVASMQEYMRGLFLLTYVLPLSAMAYLFVRVSQELKSQDGPLAVVMYEAPSRDASGRLRTDSTCHSFRSEQSGLYDAELDVSEERRTNKYLVSMVTAFAVCLCPLMVLRMLRLVLRETYDNTAHLDVTYTLFVWFAFLHTISTPALFASWTMSPLEKERLRLYFRFCERRRLRQRSESAVDAVVQQQQQQSQPDSSQPTSPQDEDSRASDSGVDAATVSSASKPQGNISV